MSATNPTVEQDEMGRVLTDALVENLTDFLAVETGRSPGGTVRQVHLTDALVDTGATLLALPVRYIRQLGLVKTRERDSVSAQGKGTVNIYEPVRLTILDRFCAVEVMEVSDDTPPLIGQIPLETLDLVIDLRGHRLTGNPAHGGVETLELY
jgi:predicted aspartyl protease